MVSRKVVRKTSIEKNVESPSRGFVLRIDPFSLAQKALPALYVGVVLLAFAFGALWQKVDSLQKNISNLNTTAQPTAQATPSPITMDQVKDLFSKDLIKFGDANKRLVFVTVEDPSCPYCHAAAGLNPKINNQFGPQFKLVKDGGTYVAPVAEMRKLVDRGEASLVYIYTIGHGNGEMGQKALYCAYEKGKFWQAHDLLYSEQGYELQNTTVLNDKSKSQTVATFLKSAVDPVFMKECLDSGRYDDRLTTDAQVAASLSVSGTPGFFVNTTRFAGAYSYTDMESTVNSALGK